jgi:branched-subunit amino acid transport protein
MIIWLVIFIGGLLTFGMRFSLIYLFGRYQVPVTMRKALHYVPPAVFSAIILPELIYSSGNLDLTFGNIRLLAGIIAILVAWYTKNTLLTILAGMVALLILQLLLKI